MAKKTEAKSLQEPHSGKGENPATGGKGEPAPLPFFIEVVFSFSGLLLVLVSLLIVFFSYLSGASLVDIFLRGLVGVLALGSVLWLLSYQVSSSVLTTRAAGQRSVNRPSNPSQSGDPSSGGETEQEG